MESDHHLSPEAQEFHFQQALAGDVFDTRPGPPTGPHNDP